MHFNPDIKGLDWVPESMTTIPSKTISAYKNSLYRTFTDPQLTLKIGKFNHLLPSYNEALIGAAFITAFNPFSQELSNAENLTLHERLKETVTQLGLDYTEGEGADPSAKWPAEISLYIPKISLFQSIRLAKDYRQNAIVWAGADQTPRLVLLR